MTDITITLTPAETTTVSGWLDIIRPGLSNAQKITLLQAHARHLLHRDLLARLAEARTAAAMDAENEQRRSEQAALDSVDVFAPET